jgi:hypothetical protein
VATTTSDFVTNLQGQFLENVRRSQQAVVDAIGLWAESVEKIAPDASRRTAVGRLPSAEELIDNTFDFADDLIAAQRQFAKTVLSATASGVEAAKDKTDSERAGRKPTAKPTAS